MPEGRYSKDAFGVADAFIIVRKLGILPVQFKTNSWGETGKYKEWCKQAGVHLIVVRKDDRKGFRMRMLG